MIAAIHDRRNSRRLLGAARGLLPARFELGL